MQTPPSPRLFPTAPCTASQKGVRSPLFMRCNAGVVVRQGERVRRNGSRGTLAFRGISDARCSMGDSRCVVVPTTLPLCLVVAGAVSTMRCDGRAGSIEAHKRQNWRPHYCRTTRPRSMCGWPYATRQSADDDDSSISGPEAFRKVRSPNATTESEERSLATAGHTMVGR